LKDTTDELTSSMANLRAKEAADND